MTLFKKTFFSLILGIVLISLNSCTLIYPVNATSNPVGSKVGMASATFIMGINFNADISLRKAAQSGNIKLISTVDIKVENYVFYSVVTTIITGE